MSCPLFWTEDPSVLLREAADFFPFHKAAQKCSTIALNAFTRFGLYLGLLLAIITGEMRYLLLGIGLAVVAAAAYHGMKSKGVLREGFQAQPKYATSSVTPLTLNKFPEQGLVVGSDAADEYVNDIIGSKERTEPTAANPFMNVLLTEIGDNPMRAPAENGEFMKRQFSQVFQGVYGDPGDVFQKTQNQRTWAVQPITSIPNDQESFQNWLFRTPGRTCKEGNSRACTAATEGGQLTWRQV
jgi:hypothetical protein